MAGVDLLDVKVLSLPRSANIHKLGMETRLN